MTRPPKSPFEVQRFNELKALGEQGKRISTGKLLSFGPEFYTGDPSEVWSRYLHSWALCDLANTNTGSSELLRAAVAARLAGHPNLAAEAELDSQLKTVIAEPVALTVSKDLMAKAAEDIFKQDETFAGVIYAWQYIADPTNLRTLIYLGDSLYLGSDYNAAQKYYREGQRLRPESALPLIRLGDVEKEAGNLPKAIEFWRRAERTSSTEQDEDTFRKGARERLIKSAGR
jgi:tetratricopeptide (TPR) repeat protein